MLDPDVVLNAVVVAFQSIPAVVTELGGLIDNAGNQTIVAHYFSVGEENSLTRAVYEMSSPSILVAYTDLLGGNFDGNTVWKHRLEIYVRGKNRAMAAQLGQTKPSNPLHLCWLLMHEHIGMTGQNFRQTSLLNSSLHLCDTPTFVHKTDETGADYFFGQLVLPEAGDD